MITSMHLGISRWLRNNMISLAESIDLFGASRCTIMYIIREIVVYPKLKDLDRLVYLEFQGKDAPKFE